MNKDYDLTIGLEVHVELKTDTKIFCNCSTEFGSEPNTNTCPVCMGFPGALPVLNEKVVDYAIQAGLATNCEITRRGKQDRKHYFYPDLPTAYQISQDELPICHDGFLEIEGDGYSKKVGINRIHIEEDAGKLVHKEDDEGTLIDYNRCGVPLIEIVTEPDLSSADEVRNFLQKLRAIILYLGISDAKMNEGSFRCDVNLSIKEKGSSVLGTRTEMKNLNSFQSIVRAINYESQRHLNAISNGEEIVQETRRFDQNTGRTYSMRKKEDAVDYRYLPDPDLMPIVISEEKINSLRANLPELPDARKAKYIEDYGLVSYDAEQLTSSIELANYFEAAAEGVEDVKTLANILISEIFRLTGPEEFAVPFPAAYLSELVNLIDKGTINSGTSKKIIETMWKDLKKPSEIVKEEGLEQINDEAELLPIVKEVVARNERAVKEYLEGNDKAIQAIIGQVMGRTKGKANPQLVIELIKFEIK